MPEAAIATTSEIMPRPISYSPEENFSSPRLPEIVQKFLETSHSQRAIVVTLTEERFSLLDSAVDPHPIEAFNRAFKQDYPVVFNDHFPRNRIVLSYLTPELPLDFSESVEFVLQPNALARDSAHGVFFGILRPAHDNSLPGIPIAVKPYSGETTLRAYSKAWREFINSHIVFRRNIPTIKPLVLIFDDKNAYIISRRERLTALGDVVWEPFRRELGTLRVLPDIEHFIRTKYKHLIETNPGSGFASPDQQLSQYLTTLKNLASCIAQLHLNGIFPKDSQIKNFVSETLTNQFCQVPNSFLRLL